MQMTGEIEDVNHGNQIAWMKWKKSSECKLR